MAELSEFVAERVDVLVHDLGERNRKYIIALLTELEKMPFNHPAKRLPIRAFVESHLAMAGLVPMRTEPYTFDNLMKLGGEKAEDSVVHLKFECARLQADLERLVTVMRTGLEPPSCCWSDDRYYRLALSIVALKENVG